jgi:hypothetical protein
VVTAASPHGSSSSNRPTLFLTAVDDLCNDFLGIGHVPAGFNERGRKERPAVGRGLVDRREVKCERQINRSVVGMV